MNVNTALVVGGIIVGALSTHFGQWLIRLNGPQPLLVQRTYSLSYNYGSTSPAQVDKLVPAGSGERMMTLCGAVGQVGFTLKLRDQMLADARLLLEKDHGTQAVTSMGIVPMSLNLIEEKVVSSCSADQK